MSNTVRLYALTGETAVGQSLSTAADAAGRLAARARRTHGFDVPVIWHDVDYPLAKVWNQGSGTIEWHANSASLDRLVTAVDALGGTVRRLGPYREPTGAKWDNGTDCRSYRWQLVQLDVATVEKWVAHRGLREAR